jgi:hypothetical protein
MARLAISDYEAIGINAKAARSFLTPPTALTNTDEAYTA